MLDSAKRRAVSEFAAVICRLLPEADARLAEAAGTASSEDAANALLAARDALAHARPRMVEELNAAFGRHLNHAFRTMRLDLRPKHDGVAVDGLLPSDKGDPAQQQDGLDDLAARLDHAAGATLARLDGAIAQLHDATAGTRRDNPFRPYLLARSLYDVVGRLDAGAGTVRIVLDHVAESLFAHLPAYYDAIEAAIEAASAAGSARAPTPAAPPKQYAALNGGRPLRTVPPPVLAGAGFLSAHMLPGWQGVTPARDDPAPWRRMLGMLRFARPDGGLSEPADDYPEPKPAQALPEVLQERASPSQAAATDWTSLSPQMLGRIAACRKEVQQQPPGLLPLACRLPAFRSRLLGTEPSSVETLMVDLVGALFEWIGADDTITPRMRGCLMRLELPFLRAVLQEPDLLLNPSHLSRRLVNVLGSLGTGLNEHSDIGRLICDQAVQAVDALLARDDASDDAAQATLVRCLADFDEQIRSRLSALRPVTRQCAIAIENVEMLARMRIAAANGVREIVAPLGINTQVVDFIAESWSHLFAVQSGVRAGVRAENGPDDALADNAALLTELVWSLQEKNSEAERELLLRRLPSLVKRLRAALQKSGVAIDTIHEGLDLLLEEHTKILHSTPSEASAGATTALRERFVTLFEETVSGQTFDPNGPLSALNIFASDLAAALAIQGADVELCAQEMRSPRPSVDLSAFLPGVGAIRHVNDVVHKVRLVWISANGMFYLFAPEGDGRPVLYSKATLRRVVKSGALRPVEEMPVIQRAVQGLMGPAAFAVA